MLCLLLLVYVVFFIDLQFLLIANLDEYCLLGWNTVHHQCIVFKYNIFEQKNKNIAFVTTGKYFFYKKCFHHIVWQKKNKIIVHSTCVYKYTDNIWVHSNENENTNTPVFVFKEQSTGCWARLSCLFPGRLRRIGRAARNYCVGWM